MDRKLWSLFEARANIIKALSHPARLFIVEELQKDERCVCELTDMLDFDTSTISKHLSILKNAGIVGDRRDGTKSIYYLKVPCILGFFGCIEEVMESNLKQQNEIIMACRKR
jgi:DNA-binding transcriptional ArsR family regulator